jgi:hypothetical protein
VQYLSHSASFHSLEKYAPPNAGTKHLAHFTLLVESVNNYVLDQPNFH